MTRFSVYLDISPDPDTKPVIFIVGYLSAKTSYEGRLLNDLYVQCVINKYNNLVMLHGDPSVRLVKRISNCTDVVIKVQELLTAELTT